MYYVYIWCYGMTKAHYWYMCILCYCVTIGTLVLHVYVWCNSVSTGCSRLHFPVGSSKWAVNPFPTVLCDTNWCSV